MVEGAILNEFAFRKLPAKRSFIIFGSENGGLGELERVSVPQNGSEAFLNRIWFTELVQEGFRPNFLTSKINAFRCDRSLLGQAFVRDRTRGKHAGRRNDEAAIGTVSVARAEAPGEAGTRLSKPQ